MVKVDIKIDKDVLETTIIIVTNEIDDEVLKLQEDIINLKPNLLSGFNGNRFEIIKEENIIRLYTSEGRVYIVTKDKEYVTRQTLQELENELNKNYFIRISRFDIINLDKIKSFDLSFVGTISVEMINGDVLYVSRRKLKEVKSYLGI
ncbi:MAG: LytTR family DNA-binding domain-containing protein [Acholeplasmataceae bacterium]|jgi:DNA-binding LytR/AlgR family response regulator